MRVAAFRISTILLLLAHGAGSFGQTLRSPPKFVVHEWGVAIRGQQKPTVLEPPPELITGLPDFVLRHQQTYKSTRKNFGWDKPVIHFYGPEELKVSIRIDFAQGQPLAYWPAPSKYLERDGRQIASRKEMMIYSLSEATGCEWSGVLSAKPAIKPASTRPGHWWAAVRDVPAMYFNTAATSERFLFYEATAKQEPPISATVSDDAMIIQNSADTPSDSVIVIVNDGTTRWLEVVSAVPAKSQIKISRDHVKGLACNEEHTLAACEKQWSAAGMTADEAHAIAQTWKQDILGRVGFLMVSRMPADLYGRMFPMTITPQPDALVRVGMVFDTLEGEDHREGWLPALRQTFDEIAGQLANEDSKVRRAAERRFALFGGLAKEYLIGLSKNPDAEVANAARVLLKALQPPPPASLDPSGHPTP